MKNNHNSLPYTSIHKDIPDWLYTIYIIYVYCVGIAALRHKTSFPSIVYKSSHT